MHILRSSHPRLLNFALPHDTYARPMLLAAEDGAFHFAIEGGETGEASFGDIVLCPPGHALRRRVTRGPLLFHFFEWEDEPPVVYGQVRIGDTARLQTTLRALSRLAQSVPGNLREWRAHLLRDLLFLCWETTQVSRCPADPLMDEAAQHLVRSAGEHSLSVGDVARSVGLSAAQFSRRFQKRHGKTPQTFLTDLRLQRACARLAGSDDTIEKIAHTCGYRDGFYLCRVFTQRLRLTPSAYRTQNRI